MKLRAGNMRSSFAATSIIFGSVFGYLIATGLDAASLTVWQAVLLGVWFFALAGMAHNLLKTAENIIWHVDVWSNAATLFGVSLVALLIGQFQKMVPLDPKIWFALIGAWILQTMFVAILERPNKKELSEND